MPHDIPNYMSPDYVSAKTKVDVLWLQLSTLQDMAETFGIKDIFQDNGAKILQQLVYLNMNACPGREGNAIDCNGAEWELKSINIATGISGISTNHHLNGSIINKYRTIPWAVSIYNNDELLEIYIIGEGHLEPLFEEWERKLETRQSLNNPKISLNYVKQNGICVYNQEMPYPVNPMTVIDTRPYYIRQEAYRQAEIQEQEAEEN